MPAVGIEPFGGWMGHSYGKSGAEAPFVLRSRRQVEVGRAAAGRRVTELFAQAWQNQTLTHLPID